MRLEDEIPTAETIYEYVSRFNPEQYSKIVNDILIMYTKPKRRRYNRYIIDSTPVACDINVSRDYIDNKKLEELKLKWGYSTTKGQYIGFKVTMVLDDKNMVPVAILIHPGSPNDAKLFEPTLKELQRRRTIKNKDIIICDIGYYSYKNYQI